MVERPFQEKDKRYSALGGYRWRGNWGLDWGASAYGSRASGDLSEVIRQRHTYPNSELCAERNTLAIKFFCRRGAVAGRA